MTRTVIEPPPPPEIPRRVRVSPTHGFAIALFSAIILLAAFGLLGGTEATADARTAGIGIEVSYPLRVRYRQNLAIEVEVTNRSTRVIDTVTVTIANEYLEAFSGVQFTPKAVRPGPVELSQLAPGESRRVQVEVQAEQYGSHRGSIRATAAADTPEVQVRTIVFP